jgi:mannose-6-phosphate isomerase-like protein (cupin superfamily)
MKVRLPDKLAQFADHWNPRIVARHNDSEVRVAKLLGAFTWHAHPTTDELFLCLHGRLTIEFRDAPPAILNAGDLLVVPASVEHRPVAEEECHILLIDRAGEPNTGDAPSHLTRATLDAI